MPGLNCVEQVSADMANIVGANLEEVCYVFVFQQKERENLD